MSKRIVVTGMGALTPLGADVESTWRRLLAGQSGIRRLPLSHASNPEHFASRLLAHPGCHRSSHVFSFQQQVRM